MPRMADKRKLQMLLQEKERLNKEFGPGTGAIGSDPYELNVVPTGSLALDYALGIGGWPRGHITEVYGRADIGKTACIGYGALREGQKLGLTGGLILLEPNFDKKWVQKHGVDTEWVMIARHNTVEDAFETLIKWCHEDLVDIIVFDSIGASVSEVERKEGAKARVGGQSSAVTDGVKRITMPVFKQNKLVILLNQVREDMDARYAGAVKPPGGKAIEHLSSIIVHLKSKARYTRKGDIEGETLTLGYELVAIIERNKLAEGTNRRAIFDFYQMTTDEHAVGVDRVSDIINTAMRCGVIRKAGSYYRHPVFPRSKSGEHQVFGKDGVAEFFAVHPESVAAIRSDVLATMCGEQSKLRAAKDIQPKLEVVE